MTDLVAAVRDGRVVVVPGPHGPTLPVELEGEGHPSPGELARAVGAATVRPLAPSRPVSAEPRLTVHLVEPGGVAAAQWLELDSLDRLVHPPSVAEAIRTGLGEHGGTLPWPPRRPPWFAAGWRAAIDAFVDETLASAGRQRAGSGRVVQMWTLSAVLEIPVAAPSAGSVFVKATCDHFRAEPTITALLSRLAPGRVPQVLAVDAGQGWMVMEPLPGTDEDGRAASAPDAARVLAELQVLLADRTDELLAAGVADRTARPTVAALRRLVRESVELDRLTAEERQQLHQLLPWLERQVAELAASGLPDTLGHGDLHTGNFVVGPRGPVLFDWTDAALTFPALDAVLLAQSAGGGRRAATLAAYAAVWRAARPAADVARALELAAAVHPAYQAISYEGIARAQEHSGASGLSGLVARNLRSLVGQWQQAGRPLP